MECRRFIFCCCLFTICFSCVSEPKEAPLLIEDVLPGYWELIDATRNDKQVPSLEGAYFEFDSLGTISTNFSGEQVVTDYRIVDNAIFYNESNRENKLDYYIRSKDTLQFNTVMRKIFKFELIMLRTAKDK